mgnify:CR=1 FL=1
MKLTKSIIREIILEVLSEEDEEEQTPQQPDDTKKIKTDIPDNPFEDEEKETNESLISKIKEELKKYEI